MTEWTSRFAMLVGEDAVASLSQKRVAIFGVGGVGGHATEALARSGSISLRDRDAKGRWIKGNAYRFAPKDKGDDTLPSDQGTLTKVASTNLGDRDEKGKFIKGNSMRFQPKKKEPENDAKLGSGIRRGIKLPDEEEN